MSEGLKQAAEAIAQSPKTAWFSAGFTASLNQLLAECTPIVTFTAQLAGVALVVILIRYHWINTQVRRKELQEANRKSKELDDELK